MTNGEYIQRFTPAIMNDVAVSHDKMESTSNGQWRRTRHRGAVSHDKMESTSNQEADAFYLNKAVSHGKVEGTSNLTHFL